MLKRWQRIYACDWLYTFFGGANASDPAGSENPPDVPRFCEVHSGSDLGILIWSRLGRLDARERMSLRLGGRQVEKMKLPWNHVCGYDWYINNCDDLQQFFGLS